MVGWLFELLYFGFLFFVEDLDLALVVCDRCTIRFEAVGEDLLTRLNGEAVTLLMTAFLHDQVAQH